jgi:hypothetical protein
MKVTKELNCFKGNRISTVIKGSKLVKLKYLFPPTCTGYWWLPLSPAPPCQGWVMAPSSLALGHSRHSAYSSVRKAFLFHLSLLLGSSLMIKMLSLPLVPGLLCYLLKMGVAWVSESLGKVSFRSSFLWRPLFESFIWQNGKNSWSGKILIFLLFCYSSPWYNLKT